jgi:hypothetical protein
MMTAIETTESRYEIKFACSAAHFHQARVWLRLHPEGFRVAYPPRHVNNIYLDTPHLDNLRANLMGVSRRQKLRLRWYGEATALVSQPMIEQKHKSNLLGSKKREMLNCVLDLEQPWVKILDVVRKVATPYWQPLLDMVNQPTILNRYRREYYITPDGALRATLDYAQAAYNQRLSRRPNRQAKLLLPDIVVIELKASAEHERRLQMSAAHFPVPRSRNSKYVHSLMATTV